MAIGTLLFLPFAIPQVPAPCQRLSQSDPKGAPDPTLKFEDL
jgi:hypothetical protein